MWDKYLTCPRKECNGINITIERQLTNGDMIFNCRSCKNNYQYSLQEVEELLEGTNDGKYK